MHPVAGGEDGKRVTRTGKAIHRGEEGMTSHRKKEKVKKFGVKPLTKANADQSALQIREPTKRVKKGIGNHKTKNSFNAIRKKKSQPS